MLSTKLRTTIIAIVAAFSFAAASVAPAVSQASKNTGAYSKSSEAKAQKQLESFCGDLQGIAQGQIGYAVAAELEGDALSAAYHYNDANETIETAKGLGCSWASRVQLPLKGSPISGLRTPVQSITATS
jgi:hypothetical protein